MNCRQLHKEIVPYCTNELPPQVKEAVERHLQLCPVCARFAHEISRTIQDAQTSRITVRSRNLWPDVRDAIESRRHTIPRWALSFACSLILVGALFTGNRLIMPQRLSPEEMQVVTEMEFLSDYDLWENLDVLESSEILQEGQSV